MKIEIGELPNITHEGLALDIDETLSYTIGYWVSEMQRLFGNPENLSVDEIVEKYRYAQNVPYWQTPEALAWTEAQRNSDGLQTRLPLIKDADLYVRKINEIVPIVAYISIRPEIVINGTKTWLDMYGFPKAPIICRPKGVPIEYGSEWKARVLEKLYPKVVGIIDDNSSVLKFLDKDYKGVIFLYDHKQSVVSNTNIFHCEDWSKVYDTVKAYFNDINYAGRNT
ncbi:MAG: hypothetical protein ACP5OA_03970 [Candidatus Woesearchaeota archaeon]